MPIRLLVQLVESRGMNNFGREYCQQVGILVEE